LIKKIPKNKIRLKKHWRIRKNINGTAEKPRLVVFRSLKNIYAQIVNDLTGNTLVAASSLNLQDRDGLTKKEEAKKVGMLLAEKAKEKGLENVVFDRGGYIYHGRVQALADGAREGGLNF